MLAIIAATAIITVWSDGRAETHPKLTSAECADVVSVYNTGRTVSQELAFHLSVAPWRKTHPCKIVDDYANLYIDWHDHSKGSRRSRIDQEMTCSLPDGTSRIFYRQTRDLKQPHGWASYDVKFNYRTACGYSSITAATTCTAYPATVTKEFCAE